MIHFGSVFEAFWTVICSFSVLHASKKHMLSRMKVRTSSKTIFSTGLPKKFENQCKSRTVRFTRVLQCYFYSGHIHKAHKSTKSRFLVNNNVFQGVGVFSSCFMV